MRVKSFLLLAVFLIISEVLFAATLSRTYKWNYKGKLYTTTLQFESSTYDYYKKRKRDYYDFTVYTHENASYPIINKVAVALKGIAQKNNFSDWQTVEFISAFVQHLRYVGDGKYEYPRYPAETLVDMGGDCEDTSILLASLLMSLGYKSILISPKGHMGVGIAVKGKYPGVSVTMDGQNYYYIETTEPGWYIGEYPEGLTAEANLLDPGAAHYSKLLAYSGSNYSSPSNKPAQSVAVKNETTSTENKSAYQFKDNYVLSTDVVVVDGKQEMIVTKVEH